MLGVVGGDPAGANRLQPLVGGVYTATVAERTSVHVYR